MLVVVMLVHSDQLVVFTVRIHDTRFSETRLLCVSVLMSRDDLL